MATLAYFPIADVLTDLEVKLLLSTFIIIFMQAKVSVVIVHACIHACTIMNRRSSIRDSTTVQFGLHP